MSRRGGVEGTSLASLGLHIHSKDPTTQIFEMVSKHHKTPITKIELRRASVFDNGNIYGSPSTIGPFKTLHFSQGEKKGLSNNHHFLSR
jgi:hypothetical protein